MKLAFTVSDFGAAANVGAGVDNSTYIVDMPDELIPAKVKWAKKVMDECPPGKSCWLSITITQIAKENNE